jgi:MFS family permease
VIAGVAQPTYFQRQAPTPYAAVKFTAQLLECGDPANCLARGSSTLVIGILTSIWALPFLLAAPIYTRIVGRVSAKPALLVGMSADVVCVWLFPLVPYDWAWIILQIVSGATLGHFSLITEAWLNLFSTERSRGCGTR